MTDIIKTLRNNLTDKNNRIKEELIKYSEGKINCTDIINKRLEVDIKIAFNMAGIGAKVTAFTERDIINIKIEIKAKQVTIVYQLLPKGFDNIINSIIDYTSLIINGIHKIDTYNQEILNNSNIRFKIGLDKYCKISGDWDCKIITIQLSEKAVKNIVTLDIRDRFIGEISLRELIHNYNSIPLLNQIGIELETHNFQKEVLKEVISEDKVIELINSNETPYWQIKYYSIIDKRYLVKVMCDIDREQKETKVKIIGNLYDLKEDVIIERNSDSFYSLKGHIKDELLKSLNSR